METDLPRLDFDTSGWCCSVSSRTGWPGVSTLWQERDSKFDLQITVSLSEQIRPWNALSCCCHVQQQTKKPTYRCFCKESVAYGCRSLKSACGMTSTDLPSSTFLEGWTHVGVQWKRAHDVWLTVVCYQWLESWYSTGCPVTRSDLWHHWVNADSGWWWLRWWWKGWCWCDNDGDDDDDDDNNDDENDHYCHPCLHQLSLLPLLLLSLLLSLLLFLLLSLLWWWSSSS